METKNSVNTIKENVNPTINVTPTFQNFPFWIAPQQNAKYRNIINTMNQLLNMYRPEDGITAYENVLKTLLALSENFDSNMRQRIISIIPLPKGASDDEVKDVIHKSTDLIKLANSSTIYQNIVLENKFNTEALDEKLKMHLNPNTLSNVSPQTAEVNENFVPEVFRGFAPNEISMIHSHVKNVNYVYNTLDINIPCIEACINIKQNFSSNVNEQKESLKLRSKLEWFCTPHLLCKANSYQGTASCSQATLNLVDHTYFQLSVGKLNNSNHCNIANVPHALHQDNAYFKRELYKDGVILNKQEKAEVSNLGVHNGGCFPRPEVGCKNLYNEDTSHQSKKYNNINKTKISNTEMYKYFAEKLRNEQVTQQDIYKMDVVCYNERRKNAAIESEAIKQDDFIADNFVVHEKLKTSLQNFLKRAEQDILIELPVLPRIKSQHIVPSVPKYWSILTEKNRENNESNILSNAKNTFEVVNRSENRSKYTKKEPLRSLHTYPKSARLQVFNRNLNTVIGKTQAIECEKRDEIENLQYKFKTKQAKRNNLNVLQQSVSITELATFKKQYYDTLLNIQKAKAAVANSMALSVETSAKYDSYYSNRSYQQQHEQLTGHPQFAVHTATQSGLSNMYNTPYSWMKYGDWKHPTTKQFRFQQQFPLQLSRNKE